LGFDWVCAHRVRGHAAIKDGRNHEPYGFHVADSAREERGAGHSVWL
jgi:hypothetical protein